jgi:hypothetical protein
MRQRDDIQQSNIPFPSFHASDVVSMKTGKLGQLFLR